MNKIIELFVGLIICSISGVVLSPTIPDFDISNTQYLLNNLEPIAFFLIGLLLVIDAIYSLGQG